ncbi:MAG: diaminopropionate ammonia-lyase [Acidobacteriota bacterium]|jgi:diaminopropionate ammonia-lyase
MEARFRLLINDRFDCNEPYPEAVRAVLDSAAFEVARAEIGAWPEYRATPLRPLDDVADRCAVEAVLLKDESQRFGLCSFKAIGGAYGVLRALQGELQRRFGLSATGAQLRAGEHRRHTADIVLACATDGNHGRAVAWAARSFGCPCEVFVPRIVSEPRRRAIEDLGARVRVIDGTYDDALAALHRAAAGDGWVVVSDQAQEGYEAIPRDIMQGYTLIADEALQQWPYEDPPTHVFLQAGVGGFAGAMCAHLWERCGERRPLPVCIEPLAADCLYRSAAAGRPARVPGDLDTVMACLSCGEPSTLGWRILERGAAAYLAIDDQAAIDAMRLLARRRGGGLVVGESGAAGLAGLLLLAGDRAARAEIGLGRDARVLLFATEGATDPVSYASLIGVSPAEVASGLSTSG